MFTWQPLPYMYTASLTITLIRNNYKLSLEHLLVLVILLQCTAGGYCNHIYIGFSVVINIGFITDITSVNIIINAVGVIIYFVLITGSTGSDDVNSSYNGGNDNENNNIATNSYDKNRDNKDNNNDNKRTVIVIMYNDNFSNDDHDHIHNHNHDHNNNFDNNNNNTDNHTTTNNDNDGNNINDK